MKKQNLIGMVALMMLLIVAAVPYAFAEETTLTEAELAADVELGIETDDAGVSPDSALYGVDKAWDRLRLAWTFDKAKKAEKSLEIARERLLEVRKMLEEGKTEDAAKAEKEYDSSLDDSEEAIVEIESSDDEDDVRENLVKLARLRNQTQSHYERVLAVKERILEQMEDKLTPEQYERLQEIFEKIENKSAQVDIKLDARADLVRTKYKIVSGKSEIEVEIEENSIDDELGVKESRRERVAKHIEKAKERIAKAREKLQNSNLTEEEKAELQASIDFAEETLFVAETALKSDSSRSEDLATSARAFGNDISAVARTLGDIKRNRSSDDDSDDDDSYDDSDDDSYDDSDSDANERIKNKIEDRREEHKEELIEKLRELAKYENKSELRAEFELRAKELENLKNRLKGEEEAYWKAREEAKKISVEEETERMKARAEAKKIIVEEETARMKAKEEAKKIEVARWEAEMKAKEEAKKIEMARWEAEMKAKEEAKKLEAERLADEAEAKADDSD